MVTSGGTSRLGTETCGHETGQSSDSGSEEFAGTLSQSKSTCTDRGHQCTQTSLSRWQTACTRHLRALFSPEPVLHCLS